MAHYDKKNQSKTKDGSPKKKGYIYILSALVVGLLAITLAAIFFGDSKQAPNIGELPNYTEIRGKYEAKGLKYEKQPHLGNPSAKIKIIEFADFKCPSCKDWEAANMDRFKKEYIDTGKVELYFMNFAFIDRDSIMAASAGEAIAAQSNDKFWEFKSKLFENQGDETEIWATQEFLLDFVKKNIDGIDYDRFVKDFKEQTYMLPVKEDFKTAAYYGVNGTPQFMIDGKLLESSDYDELAAAIDANPGTAQ